MATSSRVQTNDGISWYVERSGSGPDLLLIPSGEGDCGSFSHLCTLLRNTFTVTTFDMPGMSRTSAPTSATSKLSAFKLADQVVSLMDALSIPSAVVYGSSSGGATALAMVAHHPSRITRAIIHEIPLHAFEGFNALAEANDEVIVKTCQEIFGTGMNENTAAWEALGPEFHARLERNYVKWVREYAAKMPVLELSVEELTRRPVTWTIGALSPAGNFFDNAVVATRAGIGIGVLECKHFPQLSIPEGLADHIRGAAGKGDEDSSFGGRL